MCVVSYIYCCFADSEQIIKQMLHKNMNMSSKKYSKSLIVEFYLQ